MGYGDMGWGPTFSSVVPNDSTGSTYPTLTLQGGWVVSWRERQCTETGHDTVTVPLTVAQVRDHPTGGDPSRERESLR